MTDPAATPTDSPPPAPEKDMVVKRGLAGLFSIWLVPIVALAIGGWLVFQSISEKGPVLMVSFETADGIEAGKTPVRYKDVTVGTVEALTLKRDLSGVDLSIQMIAGSEEYLNENTRFWVVRPTVTLRGISGLGTLVSGSYIEIDPGSGSGSPDSYVGLEEIPLIRSGTAGTEFTLLSDRLGSYDTGSPIYYRGFEAGEVLGVQLRPDNKSIATKVFVNEPYDKLVSRQSRFWNASGVSLSVDADGFKVDTASLQSMLLGGIEFSTPENLLSRDPAPAGHSFHLYDSEEDIEESQYTEKVSYILYFRGSVRGLSIGAPVEFKGIRVGTVSDIRLEIDPDSSDFFIPVLIKLEPQRIRFTGNLTEDEKGLQKDIQAGLRAQLKTGSFLTGQLFVDLVYEPTVEAVFVNRPDDPYPEIPTIATSLEKITTSVTQLVEKIEKLPIEELSQSMLRTAEGVEQLVTSDEIRQTAATLNSTLKEYQQLAEEAQGLTRNLDRTVIPEASATLGDARATLQQAEKTILAAQTMFGAANSMLSEGSPLRYDLEVMLRELSASARSIRNLSTYLERNPSALITGKTPPGGTQ